MSETVLTSPVGAHPRQARRSSLTLTPARLGRGVLLLAIFTLGAAFRFADLGLMRFSYDNSYTIYDALRGLSGAGWPSMGQPSSVFLPSPTLMTYIEALPLLIWRSPWSVTIFIVALNTLAIGFVFWAARELLGGAASYTAAMLFAINPWLVYYSRETWVSSLMPFFVTLIAAGLWPTLAAERRSPTGVLIAALAVTAMTQTYIAALGLLIPIGLLLFLFRSRIPRRPVSIGAIVFVAALSLYGLGLLAMQDTTLANLNKFVSGGGELHLTAEGINHALRFVTGMDFHAQYSELALGSDLLSVFSQLVYGVLTLALIGGIGLAVRAIWQKRGERRTAVVLLIGYFVPVLLMTVTSHPVHPYYLLLSVPAGHLLAAWGFLPLTRRLIGRVVGAVLCCGAVVFGLNLHWFNVNTALHPTNPKLDGWTLESGVQLGNVVQQLTADTSSPQRVVVDALPSLIGSLSSQYLTVLSGVAYPDYVVLPGAEPLLYVLVNAASQPEIFGPHAQSFPEKDLQFVDGTRASFIRVMPYDRVAALALPQVKIDWPSAAGLTLLGYTLSSPIEPGRPIDLVTYWRVDADLTENSEWFVGAFYQLFDQHGQSVTKANGHGQWARRWQEGDVYVERTRIDLPAALLAGNYHLKVGLFDSIHSQAYEFQPPDGVQATYNIPLDVAVH